MDSKEFGNYLARLREKAGFESQASLAKVSGVWNSTIARIEAGQTKKPDPDTLAKLAPYLNMTAEELMRAAGYFDAESESDDIQQYEVIACADELPEDNTEEVADLLNVLVATKAPRSQGVSDTSRLTANVGPSLKWIGHPHAVPVYDRVPYGTPAEVASYQIGIAMAYDSKADYLLKVSGDSMSPDINNGELVEVQVTRDAEPNQVVVVLTAAGETTLKYLAVDPQKGPVLRSLNPTYKDIPAQDISCIQGIVLGVKKPMPQYQQTPAYDRLPGRAYLQEDSKEAYETNKHLPPRMIGPELCYSTGLEAAAKAAGFKFDMKMLELDNSIPPSDVAAILGLAPDEQALKRTRIQTIDGTPCRIITSWMPEDLFADIVDQRPRGKPLFEMLQETKGIYPVRVEERIRTSSMSPELATLLKSKQGACTLEIQRVVYADNGRVLEVAFIAAAGMLWELAYKYAAGGRISAPDWSWLRCSPASSGPQAGAGRCGDTVR